MAAINAANLQFRFSGGASNTVAGQSIGGARSTLAGGVIGSQLASVISNISGLTVSFCGGMTVGAANTVRHAYAGNVHTLELMDAMDGTYGPAVDVSAGGTFFLAGSNRGSLAVVVAQGSLPMTNQTGTFTVTNIKNNLFDDVAKIDALNGATDYRCLYLYNTHDTEAFLQVSVYGYGADGNVATAGDKFWIAADPAGAGDGTSTGIAISLDNELDTTNKLSSIVFGSPVLATPLVLGAIQPHEGRAIWIKRTVPPLLFASTPDDYVAFGLKLIY